MTDKELEILRQLQPGNIIDFDEEDESLQDILHTMSQNGYIRHFIDGSAMIEPKGTLALKAATEALAAEQQRAKDKMRKEAAENERKEVQRLKERMEDRRFNAFWSVVNGVICGVTGVLLTLLIEHVILPLLAK